MKKILFITIVFSIVLLSFASVFKYILLKRSQKQIKERLLNIASEQLNSNIKLSTEENIKTKEEKQMEEKTDEEVIGILEIPKLDLKAPIKEGTSKEVLKYSVGHFQKSSIWYNNVSLAAHSTGAYINYFRNINKLIENDDIFYKTKFGNKQYKVTMIKKIDSFDWSYVLSTKENTITLITCVKNNEKNRLCVIGESI